MAKSFRRIFAMVMVLCMAFSALPVQALAAEEEAPALTVTETITGAEVTITFTPTSDSSSSVTVSGNNESGAAVDLTGTSTTTTTTSTDSSGTTTESTSTRVELSGKETPADGNVMGDIKVSYEDTTTSTTVTDADGNQLSAKEVTSGKETKEWTEKDSGDGQQPSVEVELIPGKTTSNTATSTTVEGQITTTTTDRTVEATTSNVETVVDTTNGEMTTLQPVKHENIPSNKNIDDITYKYWDNPDDLTVTGEAPDGYNFQLVGSGQQSNQYISRIYVVYEKDDAGNPIQDENGNYVIDRLEKWRNGAFVEVLTVDGIASTDINASFDQATGTTAAQGILKDENGNTVYVYCCDLGMDSLNGTWFSVSNLEDVDYFASEEAENHVRNIVTNGYWGTESGSGSLELIKQELKEALKNGKIEPTVEISYKNKDGKNVTETVTLTEEIIDGLTSGEALDMTQAAIWAYSNGCQAVQDGRDGYLVGNVTYGDSKRGSKINTTDDPAGMARMVVLYNWLLGLDEEIESTTVINEKNNVEDMSLSIGEKVTDHTANMDNDSSNDVYHAEMNFTLAFVPGEKDEMYVCLMDGENQPIIGADGLPIKKLLASENSEKQGDNVIKPDGNGVYTLTGLKLSENSKYEFDLRLEGTQYLENGVYLYTAHAGIDQYQTMVGITEGTHTVNVSKSMTISFDVDENNHVVAERTWNNEYDPSYTPDEPTPYDGGEDPVPQVFQLDNNDDVETIPEEEVPLAAAPITGDISNMWVTVILMAMFCLAAIHLFEKKHQHEAF